MGLNGLKGREAAAGAKQKKPTRRQQIAAKADDRADSQTRGKRNNMESLKWNVPQGRCIVHHARFVHELPSAAATAAGAASSAAAAAPSAAKPASCQPTARHRQEVWRRTIEEHAINERVEIVVPRVPRGTGIAASASSGGLDPFDAASFFSTGISAPFFQRVTLPLTALLSGDFLRRYVLQGRLYGLSVRAAADRACAVQLSPPGHMLLRLDTDAFELLGLESVGPASAHSSFKVCSSGGPAQVASKPNVRERVVTVDLRQHARNIVLHTEKDKTAANAAAAATIVVDSAIGSSADAKTSAASKVDKRLERLRWCLSPERIGLAELVLVYVNDDGVQEEIQFTSGGNDAAVSVTRVDIKPTERRLGLAAVKPGEDAADAAVVAVPSLRDFAKLLPPREVASTVRSSASDSSASSAPASKKARVDHSVPAAPQPSPSSAEPFCPSVFPDLPSSGMSSRQAWSDLSTWLGLVSLGSLGTALLADPNNARGSNVFQTTPLCPALTFVHDDALAAAASSATTAAESKGAEALASTMDDGADMVPLASSSSSKAEARKRKRAASGAAQPSGPTSVTLPSPAGVHVLRYSSGVGGLLSPSFVHALVLRCRALLQREGSKVPFVALTVHGAHSAITSWRDKEHQVWMAGSGSAAVGTSGSSGSGVGGSSGGRAGGGENCYTLVIMHDEENSMDEQSSRQQHVAVMMMLGELDRTH
jgi:hypothetical protein